MKPRFKPFDRPDGEDVWYCHATSRPPERPSSKFNKALSQVPDLNNGKDSSHLQKEESKKYVKGAIHPSDTKYIRLAKAGGRKHLLSFVENQEKSKSPQPYPVPNWYGHHNEKVADDGVTSRCPERPDWMTYLENTAGDTKDTGKYAPNQGIIAWDKMSAWKREEFERQMELKTKSTYEKRKKKHQQSEKQHKTVKPKVNMADTKSGKLPDITKSQFQGFRKLSGTELATHWYKKWYLIGKA